jgi:hypothetical protein
MFNELELKHRLPYIGDGAPNARGVVGYGMDYDDHNRRFFVVIRPDPAGQEAGGHPRRFDLAISPHGGPEAGEGDRRGDSASILVRADQVFQ